MSIPQHYTHIKNSKDALRAEYRTKRKEISLEDRAKWDGDIADKAVSMVSFKYADFVLMYAPMDGEIDVLPIAQKALDMNKRVAFPLSDFTTRTMKFHFVSSLSELRQSEKGIAEPPSSNPVYNPETDKGSSICFIPGLVFDKNGFRLGYGKGFYDRYLSSFGGCKVGVVYSDFILKSVPHGKYDVKADILLSEKGVKLSSES